MPRGIYQRKNRVNGGVKTSPIPAPIPATDSVVETAVNVVLTQTDAVLKRSMEVRSDLLIQLERTKGQLERIDRIIESLKPEVKTPHVSGH